jgi:hypothetical protein
MSTDDLENFEADRELALAQEYHDVSRLFRYAVETERRFYLCDDVDVEVLAEGARPMVRLELRNAWVWDMYRPRRFVPVVRVITFKDVNIEELAHDELEPPRPNG